LFWHSVKLEESTPSFVLDCMRIVSTEGP
jgi:hypothetical protein